MSEDCHPSDNNPDIDPTVCCIFGCGDPSTVCLDSNWYCDTHGKEYERDRDRSCAEPGCTETGVISSSNTTAKFCVNHAWKQDRTVDEHGLNHPEPKTEENLGKEIIKYVSPVKKSLEDVLTRWQALADFQDYIANGLDVMTTTLANYDNPANIPAVDAARKKGLEHALKLIEVYQMQMAGFEQKKWDLNNILDKCVPSRDTLALIKAEKEHEMERQRVEKNLAEGKKDA
jgi:hypothetical protein